MLNSTQCYNACVTKNNLRQAGTALIDRRNPVKNLTRFNRPTSSSPQTRNLCIVFNIIADKYVEQYTIPQACVMKKLAQLLQLHPVTRRLGRQKVFPLTGPSHHVFLFVLVMFEWSVLCVLFLLPFRICVLTTVPPCPLLDIKETKSYRILCR